MPPVKFTPLVAPDLYPPDPKAILSAMQDRCYIASDRTLNDFSASNPLSALYEGHLFAILELLYYTNQLPDAIAVEFLKIAGIQRRLGRAATVLLTFTLSAPLGNPFYLSAGYLVSDVSNTYNFLTDSDLIIPSGSISGVVTATAKDTGTKFNLPAYTIKNLSETRAFLQSVINTTPVSGGLDEETETEARSRGFTAIRRRGLVSGDDYEQEAMTLLGEGSVARAIGLLAADKITYEKGSVHIFGLNPDGTELTFAQCLTLQAGLKQKAPIGVGVYVSPVHLVKLEVYAIASLIPGSNPEAISLEIQRRLDDYLTPGKLPLGQTVKLKELEFQVRNAGVQFVQSVSTHTADEISYSDIPLPHSYSAAVLYDLTCDLVLGGETFTYSYGEGGDKD